ncbi:MAG: lytic transglycosylase domain-containing protein [Herminiimonas sp.]|nr:lytic transglycosylase domain-containing protein [Herminiimonas sp.]
MPRLRIRLAHLLLSSAGWLTAGAAHADIFGYIDAEGTAHFSTEKLDARYQLFVRGDQEFNSAQFKGPTPGTAPVPRNRSPLFLYLVQHPNLKKYETLLEQAARDFSLEPALLKAIMAAESGFNPTAVSPKGALGLMQLMPATAERYGVAGDARKSIDQKLFDPKTNIRLGARYLHDLRTLFPGKPDLVIASYNAGEGAVQKYRNTVPPYPETRNYVQLVTQFYQFYQPIQAIQAITTSASGEPGEHRRRVQMTIPGRANMPPALALPLPLAPMLPTE